MCRLQNRFLLKLLSDKFSKTYMDSNEKNLLSNEIDAAIRERALISWVFTPGTTRLLWNQKIPT